MHTRMSFGYGMKDYEKLFHLEDTDWTKKILEVTDKLSLCNYESMKKHYSMTTLFPYFSLSKNGLRNHLEVCFESEKHAMLLEKHLIESHIPQELAEYFSCQKADTETFLGDYPLGKKQGRYVDFEEVSELPFQDFQFELGLVFYYFFPDLEQKDTSFYVAMIRELVRISEEVRIFPLLNDIGESSPLLGPLLLSLQQQGFGVEVKQVTHPDYPKGNAILRVWAQSCHRD